MGFSLSFPGVRNKKPFFHSHMTGVLSTHSNRGIGRSLKLFQRRDALARNVDRIEWTFDPLLVKNAYFNLVRLGAVVRRFLPNLYGGTTSPLHSGLPTDRLVAEWWLNSARVRQAVRARDRPQETFTQSAEGQGMGPHPRPRRIRRASAQQAGRGCARAIRDSPGI